MDFRKQKWRRRGCPNTVTMPEVRPRVSVIAAIDTEGEIYMAMTQVNTDREVFGAFLTALVEKLKSKDANYTKNYVFLLDNAKYHKGPEMFKQMKE